MFLFCLAGVCADGVEIIELVKQRRLFRMWFDHRFHEAARLKKASVLGKVDLHTDLVRRGSQFVLGGTRRHCDDKFQDLT
jgi:hypothetical protein